LLVEEVVLVSFLMAMEEQGEAPRAELTLWLEVEKEAAKQQEARAILLLLVVLFTRACLAR